MTKLLKRFVVKALPGTLLYVSPEVPDYTLMASEYRDYVNSTRLHPKKGAPTISRKDQSKVDKDTYLAKLNALKELGFYNMKVDGLWGRGSRQAEKAAKEAGYKWNGNLYVQTRPDDKVNQASLIPFGSMLSKGVDSAKELVSNLSMPSLGSDSELGHAIYLHYPNFVGDSKNALKVGGVDLGEMIGSPKLPVGHAAVILVDKNGKSRYVEYGRYANQGHIIGKERRPTVKGGNWRKFDLDPQRPGEDDSTYVARILSRLPDTHTGAYLAMSFSNVDTKAAMDAIMAEADDKNRPEYGITNTCASGACRAILPHRKGVLNKVPKPWQAFNIEGTKDIGAALWLMLPLTTGAYALDMRTQADKVYIMNQKKK